MSECGCTCTKTLEPEIRTAVPEWNWRDYLGALAVRMDIGRMNYRVAPGLYAIGRPGSEAPVFVTANYKLTFDHVRRALKGIDAWMLVLDTNGVNVWCAAGKGLFSTCELCRRIEAVGLDKVVTHRRLILPQLGASGVSAHEVAQRSGFSVTFGPVRAADIPHWLAAGRKKDRAMRTVSFTLCDRLVLIPVEISNMKKLAAMLLAAAILPALIRAGGLVPNLAAIYCGYAVLALGAIIAGAILVPALLPWLPTKSFSIKGATAGLAWAAAISLAATHQAGSAFWSALDGVWTVAGSLLLSASVAAYVGLNFTGATVFTSQSGTLLETKRALPVIAATAIIGFGLQITGAF